MVEKLTLVTLRKTCADDDWCPAVHRIEERPGKRYVQGLPVTDPAILEVVGLPSWEALVEVPDSLLPEV